MSGAIRDFRELRVYQDAFESAMNLFDLSKRWPAEERYSMTDQVRRSSRSVCANIAEAWRRRRHPAMFANRLGDADAEAGETLVWIDFAHRCRYLDDGSYPDFRKRYERYCAQLVTMIHQSDRWCGRT